MFRRNTFIVLITVAITIILLSCSTTSQEDVTVQSSPTSLPSTMIPSATSEPPTKIQPTITLTSTPEVIELNPSARGYVSMAYDSESGQVILFGGQVGDIFTNLGNYNGETWAYDVATNEWKNMNPSDAPPPSSASSLVYDVESDRVILFGAARGVSPSRDTWAYDFNSNTWTKMAAQGPALHLGSQMAYDVESDRIVLFGGYNPNRDEMFDDTRVYDYNTDTWTKVEPVASPPGQNFECMTYDTKADRVILWGGETGTGTSHPPKDPSVWAYDFNTNTWEQKVTSSSPSPRAYCALAYSDGADQIVMYGGTSLSSNEMWVYDYNVNLWTELTPDVKPGELSRHAFVYIPDLDEFILFGGQLGREQFKYTNATWIYDLKTDTWTETTRTE